MKRVPKELSEKFFDGDTLLPGFSGIGSLRGNPEQYSEAERIVLDHFFTNTHSNIYAAKDTLPSELWTLLMGQYARSSLTARDRLLNLFRDVKSKSSEDNSVPSVEDLAHMIQSKKDVTNMLTTHCKRAGKFTEEWGIDYGHASLRDSGTIRMCFEGVSQRATKFLESAREGAYQEQSTRAIPFEENWLGMPFEIRGTEFEDEMGKLNKRTIDLYKKTRNILPDFLKTKHRNLLEESNKKIKSELGSSYEFPSKDWEKVIGARVFDVARFLLPQNMTTSLGVTLNARRFQDQLTEWQSLPHWEMQLLGRAAQLEAMKIHPTLMKYGNPSEFYQDLPRRRKELFDKFAYGKKEFDFGHHDPVSNLITYTLDIEDFVLASILFNGSGEKSFNDLVWDIRGLSFDKKREIAQNMFKDKQSYEINAKDMEVGSFTFERLYDIGAFRDLQRQRGDRQQIIPYTAKIGYNMPSEIAEIGLGDEFRGLMGEVKQFYEKLESHGLRSIAEYVPLMANLIRHVTTKDPVQCFYEAKLRTQPAGNDSYRNIAQQEIKQVLEAMPSFENFVERDMNYYPLNRLPEAVKGYIEKEESK